MNTPTKLLAGLEKQDSRPQDGEESEEEKSRHPGDGEDSSTLIKWSSPSSSPSEASNVQNVVPAYPVPAASQGEQPSIILNHLAKPFVPIESSRRRKTRSARIIDKVNNAFTGGVVPYNISFKNMGTIDLKAAKIRSLADVLLELAAHVDFKNLCTLYIDDGVTISETPGDFEYMPMEGALSHGLKVFNPFCIPDRPIGEDESWLTIGVPPTQAEFFRYGPIVGVKQKGNTYRICLETSSGWRALDGCISPIPPRVFEVSQLEGGWVLLRRPSIEKDAPLKKLHFSQIILKESFVPDLGLARNHMNAAFSYNLMTDSYGYLFHESPINYVAGRQVLSQIDPTCVFDATNWLNKTWTETNTVVTYLKQISTGNHTIVNILISVGLVDITSLCPQVSYMAAKTIQLQSIFKDLGYFHRFTVQNWAALTNGTQFPLRWNLFFALLLLFIYTIFFTSEYLVGERYLAFETLIGLTFFIVTLLYIHLSAVKAVKEKPPDGPWLTIPRATDFDAVQTFANRYVGKCFDPDSHVRSSGDQMQGFIRNFFSSNPYVKSSTTSACFWRLMGYSRCFIQPAETCSAVVTAIERYCSGASFEWNQSAVLDMGSGFRSLLEEYLIWGETSEQVEWTTSLLQAYLGRRPEKRESYWRANLSYWWGRLLSGSVNAMMKLDETLIGKPESPRALKKCRLIINPGPAMASLTAPVIEQVTTRLKQALQEFNVSQEDRNKIMIVGKLWKIHFIWGSGTTPEQLNMTLQAMVLTSPGHVWIWAAGDDSLVCFKLDKGWRVIEGDFSGFDSSQRLEVNIHGDDEGTLAESLRLMPFLGMDAQSMYLLRKTIVSSVNFRFHTDKGHAYTMNLRPANTSRKIYPLPSGTAATTLFNTSTTLSAWLYVLRKTKDNTVEDYVRLFRQLGFELKLCKEHSALEDATFLKMTPRRVKNCAPQRRIGIYAIGNLVWVPVLGVGIKAGLCKKDPRTIYPRLSDMEICARYPHDIACGFLSYPSTVMTKAIVQAFYCPNLSRASPVRAWGSHSIIDNDPDFAVYNEVEIDDVWDKRYDADEVANSLQNLLQDLKLNAVIQHSLLDKILEIDY